MELDKQGSKPTGFVGKLIGKLMNQFHTNLYIKYFGNDLPGNNSVILDIGCGGGKFIQYLSDSNETYKIYGIDHSPEMVELSKRVNYSKVASKDVIIQEASVLNLPIEDNKIDIATAFETVQFWPDMTKSFSEILRVLKNDGTFVIINRYPPVNSKWWKIAKLKDDNDYSKMLTEVGFKNIDIDLKYKKAWITVRATK